MPTNMEEHIALSRANTHIEGFGPDVRTYVPCPFCCAKDWMCLPVLTTKEAMKAGATCSSCGRSAKAVFINDEPGHQVFEMVQTGGDDPPDWMEPKIRRVGT